MGNFGHFITSLGCWVAPTVSYANLHAVLTRVGCGYNY